MQLYSQIIVQKGVYSMKILIEIPENFVKHFFLDQFQDSLIRIQKDMEFDIKNPRVSTISSMFDVEVVDMLRKALRDSYERFKND